MMTLIPAALRKSTFRVPKARPQGCGQPPSLGGHRQLNSEGASRTLRKSQKGGGQPVAPGHQRISGAEDRKEVASCCAKYLGKWIVGQVP